MFVAYMILEDAELLNRAIRAYYIATKKEGGAVDQPANDSGIFKKVGKRYVVLRNVRGVLAVYRIRNDGLLKRLKRWPADEETLRYSDYAKPTRKRSAA